MRLSYRIIVLVFCTTLAVSLASIFLMRHHFGSILVESEKILADTVTQSIRNALVQDVIDRKKLRVTNLLKNLKQNDNPIQYLFVTEPGSGIFAHSFNQGFPRHLLEHLPEENTQSGIILLRKYETDAGLIYEYSQELIPGLGTNLHIGINQTHIRKALDENTWSILLISMIVTVLALIIAYLSGKRITTPLQQLTQNVQQYGSGGQVNFQEIVTNDPDITRLSSAFRDAVDERYSAISSLKEREQNLAITLNSIGDAVIATNAQGHINRMNPVAEQLTGWAAKEARGKPIKDIFKILDARTRESIESPIDTVMDTGQTVYLSNHTTLISRGGSEYQIADSAAPIKQGDEILGMVLIFNDVTEQYHLREALGKSKRDLQAILDHSPASIYVKDTRGIYLFVNRGFERLTGRHGRDINGHSDTVFSNPEFALVFGKNDEQVFAHGEVLESEDILTKGNKMRCLATVKFPLYNDKNDIYALCGITNDITERKEQAEQLRRSQRMDALGKLTGGIAHDYNNILGIIQGYSEQLVQKLDVDTKLNKYAQNIQYAAERGTKLMRKLLQFSRHDISDAAIVDINALLQDQRDILQKTLTPRIQFKLDPGNDLWSVELNAGDLENAILNMCINAMHAMEGGGKLQISTRNVTMDKLDAGNLQVPAGNYVELNISDTGSGMDEQTKDRIFDPFFTTKGSAGTGLGLSQVYNLIQRTGGAIKVYSEIGHGSRFTLYFPKTDQVSNDVAEAEDNQFDNVSGNEHVLIVDDEPEMLELATVILEPHGYTVTCANNAAEALAVLKEQRIDLMVTDVIMPDMDGYQLTNRVQKLYPHTKIQIVSGFSDDRHQQLVDESLQKQLLYKPYTSREFLVKIRSQLDKGVASIIPKVMVMDDDADMRELFRLNLEKLGFEVILASNGKEAIEQYSLSLDTADPIPVILLDLNLPGGISGSDVAAQIRELNPNVIMIVASGDSQREEVTDFKRFGFDAVMEKRFSSAYIKQVLEPFLHD